MAQFKHTSNSLGLLLELRLMERTENGRKVKGTQGSRLLATHTHTIFDRSQGNNPLLSVGETTFSKLIRRIPAWPLYSCSSGTLAIFIARLTHKSASARSLRCSKKPNQAAMIVYSIYILFVVGLWPVYAVEADLRRNAERAIANENEQRKQNCTPVVEKDQSNKTI